MAHDHPPRHKTPEIKSGAYTRFNRSADQLFEIADTFEQKREGLDTVFFKVDWNKDFPDQIDEVTVMEAIATGARRQEYKGKFAQAQFKVTATALLNGGEWHGFIWLETGLQPSGTPIEPDKEALARRLKYHDLTPINVVRSLAKQVQTIDDYLLLLHEVEQRDLQSVGALRTNAKRIANQFLAEDPSGSDIRLTSEADRDAVFEFTTLLERVDPELTTYVQSRLLGQLLRAIRVEPTLEEEMNDKPTLRHTAAKALETGLQEGLIPDKSGFVDRILTCFPLYKYPFALNLLHSTLLKRPGHPTSDNIFGMDRRAFVSQYMLSVLAGHLHDEDKDPATQYLIDTYLGPYATHLLPTTFLNSLYQLARHLKGGEDESSQPIKRESRSNASLPLAKLQSIRPAFLTVLEELQGGDPTDTEQALNEKHAAIIDTILQPVIQKKLGGKALDVIQEGVDQE